jgi:hypothetical protein
MKSAYEQINELLIIDSHSNEKYKTYLSSLVVIKLNILLKELRKIIKVDYDKANTTKKAQAELTKKLNLKLSSGLEAIKKYIIDDYEKTYVVFSGSGAHSIDSMWKTFNSRLSSTIKSATTEA